jgi:glycosyltransferase involved in cell wall biosynthesis
LIDLEQSLIKKLVRSLKYRWFELTNPYRKYSSPISIFRVEDCDLIEWATVINLHWVANFINFPTFFNHSIVKSKPVFWRTPDLYPMRGIAHYDSYITEFNIKLEDSAKNIKVLSLKNHSNINVIATSEWTKNEALNSDTFIKAKSINLIGNAIDTEVYIPKREIAEVDLKSKRCKILFVASNINNPSKGLLILIDILNKIDFDFELLIVGGGDLPIDKIEFAYNFIGNITHDKEMISIIGAVDFYISPSIEEAFGQTVLEAISCGKPVVAFNVGGIPDMVIHRKTGLLSPLGNTRAMKSNIENLLANPSLVKELGENARLHAVNHFSKEKQIMKYLELYQSAITNARQVN